MSLTFKKNSTKGKYHDRTVYIDADVLLYACAHVTDGKAYEILTVKNILFETKKEAVEWCKEHEIEEDLIVEIFEPEPLEFAISSFNEMVLNILLQCGTDTHKLCISGDSNFRIGLATLAEYKGGRAKLRIPFNLKGLKEYVRSLPECIVADDEEADDTLGIAGSTYEKVVMAHIDKDINMVPGLHFNWNSNTLYEVSELEALRTFYTQLITGDKSTDNIIGLSENKPKKRTYKTKPIETMENEDDMFEYVFCGYIKKYGEEKAYDAVVENGRLLWIRRKVRELWEPPV